MKNTKQKKTGETNNALFTVGFANTVEDLRAMNKSKYGAKLNWNRKLSFLLPLSIILSLIASVVVLIYINIERLFVTLLIGFVLFVFYFIFYWVVYGVLTSLYKIPTFAFLTNWAYRLQARSIPHWLEHKELDFYEDKVIGRFANTEISRNYSYFVECVEETDHLFLKTKPGPLVVYPKQYFSEEQISYIKSK